MRIKILINKNTSKTKEHVSADQYISKVDILLAAVFFLFLYDFEITVIEI